MDYSKLKTMELIRRVARKENRMEGLGLEYSKAQEKRDIMTEELVKRGIDVHDDSIFQEALK